MTFATLSRLGTLSLASIALTCLAQGQSLSSSSDAPGATPGGSAAIVRTNTAQGPVEYRPFSRVAIGGSISPLGISLEAVTNVNRHLNLRATGSRFGYSPSNFTTEGFTVNGKLSLASAGVSADYYPFHVGWRLSPGVMIYNGNHATANFLAQDGESFTLNDQTFYSGSGANAVTGVGRFGLGNGSPAFTMTTGWGNQIPAKGGHWSFPFEAGVAFIQDPTVSLVLSGDVCDQSGLNCVNVATDPDAQQALAAQVQKYRDDINPLKTYPILSFGVSYSFGARGVR